MHRMLQLKIAIGIILLCRNLISHSWQVRVTHCYREANTVTDKLANIAIDGPKRLEFMSSPPRAVVDWLIEIHRGLLVWS
uniref:Uncharacterized protein n=1 Tax=Manihot esculenta TaxID=3983 RepID=A0A2C9UGX9_MANES